MRGFLVKRIETWTSVIIILFVCGFFMAVIFDGINKLQTFSNQAIEQADLIHHYSQI